MRQWKVIDGGRWVGTVLAETAKGAKALWCRQHLNADPKRVTVQRLAR